MLFALGRIDSNEDMSVLLIGDARAASVDVACSRPSDFCSFGKHVSSELGFSDMGAEHRTGCCAWHVGLSSMC